MNFFSNTSIVLEGVLYNSFGLSMIEVKVTASSTSEFDFEYYFGLSGNLSKYMFLVACRYQIRICSQSLDITLCHIAEAN